MARKNRLPVDMSSVLKSSKGTLAQIKAKTNSLTSIADIVRQICPDLPDDVWKVGNIYENTLVIEVKSSAWSQRFQFEKNNITQILAAETKGVISKLEIKVSPFTHRIMNEKPAPVKTQFISDKTAGQLLDVAKNAPPGLKEKLEKLAKHSKK